MTAYLLVAIAVAPVQFALAAVNWRYNWFTPGEIRFWGLVIFFTAELIYLGIS